MNIMNLYMEGRIGPADVLGHPEFTSFLASLKRRTRRWGVKMGFGKQVTHPPEIQKWVDFFQTHRFDGGSRKDIIDLVSMLSGIDLQKVLKSTEDQVIFDNGILVVPTTRETNYTLGEPCLFFRRESRFLRSVGSVGDPFPRRKDAMRPATDDEITTYFTRLIANIGRDVFSNVINVVESQIS